MYILHVYDMDNRLTYIGIDGRIAPHQESGIVRISLNEAVVIPTQGIASGEEHYLDEIVEKYRIAIKSKGLIDDVTLAPEHVVAHYQVLLKP